MLIESLIENALGKSLIEYSSVAWKRTRQLFPQRSMLEKSLAGNKKLRKFVRKKQRRHSGSFADAEAIGPVADACRLTELACDLGDVYLESGTALAELARHIIQSKRRSIRLFIRTNSKLVDELMSTVGGCTVRRLDGSDGYDEDYAAFYGTEDETSDLIQGNGLDFARLGFMTASSIDLNFNGPHSKSKNTLHKQHILKACRPIPEAERQAKGNWDGVPIVLATEASKLVMGKEKLSQECVPIWDMLHWEEMKSEYYIKLSPMDRFINDIRRGHVLWIIYAASPIDDDLLQKLRSFNVSIRRVWNSKCGAFAYILYSRSWRYIQYLDCAPNVEDIVNCPETENQTICQSEAFQI